MFGSVSFGTWFTHDIHPILSNGNENPWANLRIENIAQWLMLQVNTPAQRGILFGLTLGLAGDFSALLAQFGARRVLRQRIMNTYSLGSLANH